MLLLVVVFLLLLPLLSGVGSYSLQKKPLRGKVVSAKNSRDEGESKKNSNLKERLNIKKEDAPVKFRMTDGVNHDSFDIDGKTGLKRRYIGKYVEDNNEFDYDVDELIADDMLQEQQEAQKHYAQFEGRENEAHEELV